MLMKRIDLPNAGWGRAEQLPAQYAEDAMNYYGTRCTPEGFLHSAWNHAEFALCRTASYDDDVRKCYFDYTQELTQMIIASPKASQDTQLGALTLSTYVPVFQKRAFDERILRDDCAKIYESLGAAMRYLRPLEIDEPPQWRMAEVAVLALSARTRQPELLLYPASPREESAPQHDSNHDSYFLTGQTKIPIQQKLRPTAATYAEYVRLLTLEPLLDKSASLAPNQTTAEKVNYLLALVIAETSGEALSRDEAGTLNFLSQAVAAHRKPDFAALAAA